MSVDGLVERADGSVTLEDAKGLSLLAAVSKAGVIVPGGRIALARGAPMMFLDERLLGSHYVDQHGKLITTQSRAAAGPATASLTWTNYPAQDGFGIAFDIAGGSPQTVVSLDISTDPHFTSLVGEGGTFGPIRNEAISLRSFAKSPMENYHSVVHRIGGLQPGARYYCAPVVDGVRGPTFTAHTLPEAGEATAFNFLFGSCTEYTAAEEFGVPAMLAMAAETDILFAGHFGDISYADIAVDQIELSRRALSRVFRANLDTGVALQAFAWLRAFDDHDNGIDDNSTETPGQLDISRNTRREYYETTACPMPVQVTLGETDPDKILPVFTWDVGKARFVQLDTRSQRTPIGSPPTMLGNAVIPSWGWDQLGWLLDTVLPQAAIDAVAGDINHLYIISPTGWSGGGGETKPAWRGYPEEQAMICDKMVELYDDLPAMTIVTGDFHFGAVDDGYFTDFSTDGALGKKLKQIMVSPFRRESPTESTLQFKWNWATTKVFSEDMFGRVEHRANGTWLSTIKSYDRGTSTWVTSAAYDSATVPDPLALYLAALTGSPSDATKLAYRILISALARAGIFDKLDGLWLLANHDAQAARINLVAPSAYTLTTNGAPDFTQFQGYQGNGTTEYLGTGFNPTTATAPKFVQDSATLFLWCLTDSSSDKADMGNANARITARTAAGNTGWRANFSTTESTGSISTSVGMTSWSRMSASYSEVYRNGVHGEDKTTASEVPDNREIRILGASGITSPPFSERKIAVAGLGSGLTDSQHTALHSALRNYLVAVGAIAP